MTSRAPKWNVYSGRQYITQVNAWTYDNACAAADHIGYRYHHPGPMIAIPDDTRIQPNDRHTPCNLIAHHMKGQVIP